MKVGFLGIQCDTANLGLAALCYAGVKLVADLIPGQADLVLFSINSHSELEKLRDALHLDGKQIRAVPFYHKRPAAMLNSIREIRSCDVVVDFTGGDSFSDIYGIRRLARKLFHKQLVLSVRTPLVLAPQTYGPLRHNVSKPWFRHVVSRAALVFTRDDISADFLEKVARRNALKATDVAIILPWDSELYDVPTGGPLRVALNVSGLLWIGGYTGTNQFGLMTDYRAYCHDLVRSLLASGHEVHLVSHVLTRPWECGDEDDVRAARELHSEHPACVMAPAFASPIEAKSYISRMDAFIGSRMHATIAAFTSGVPTVPVAYSRKFAGFFGALDYPIVVDLTTLSTTEAVTSTLAHLGERESLRAAARSANAEAQRRVSVFTDELARLFASN